MISMNKSFLPALCVVSSCVFLSGCRDPSFGNQLSTKQEVEIGRQASEQVVSQFPVAADATATQTVDAIAAKILPIARIARGDIEYHVRVLKSDDQQAFTLPGGWIYLDEGLVQKIGADKDALACVIAHEAGHVVLRHSAIQLSDAYGTDSLIDQLTEGKYQEAANISLQLAILSHSKQDEIDADRVGEKIAKVAGYDPAGLSRFLTVIQVNAPLDHSWTSIHPISKDRLKHVDQDIKDLQAGKY